MRRITLTMAAVIVLVGLAVAKPKYRPVIAPTPGAIDTLTFVDKSGFRVLVIREVGKLPVLRVVLP